MDRQVAPLGTHFPERWTLNAISKCLSPPCVAPHIVATAGSIRKCAPWPSPGGRKPMRRHMLMMTTCTALSTRDSGVSMAAVRIVYPGADTWLGEAPEQCPPCSRQRSCQTLRRHLDLPCLTATYCSAPSTRLDILILRAEQTKRDVAACPLGASLSPGSCVQMTSATLTSALGMMIARTGASKADHPGL